MLGEGSNCEWVLGEELNCGWVLGGESNCGWVLGEELIFECWVGNGCGLGEYLVKQLWKKVKKGGKKWKRVEKIEKDGWELVKGWMVSWKVD